MSAREERIAAIANEASPLFGVYQRQLLSIAGFGFVVGLVFAGGYYLLNNYVFGNVLCVTGNDVLCGRAATYSMAIATLVAVTIGLVGLVQLRGYRPILVVIASALVFWGFDVVLAGVPWLVGLLTMAILTALAYTLFNWVARLKSISLVILILAIIVIAGRLAFLA